MHCGMIIRHLRGEMNLKQEELAARLGMRPAQLSKLELGKSSPSVRTLTRVAAALDVTVAELVGGTAPEKMSEAKAPTVTSAETTLRVPTRRVEGEPELGKRVLEELARREREWTSYETACGRESATMLQLVQPFTGHERCGDLVAVVVRESLRVGQATLADLAGVLEYRNVRIHALTLPKAVASRSYFDPTRHVLSIVLNARDTPERQTYSLAYELGWACLFGSNGFRTVEDAGVPHRFARRFAASFLMPEDMVRLVVSQSGIGPRAWTLEMLCALKARFNVSAEAFALRLEDLGLIDAALRVSLRDKLRAHYAKHPRAMEPSPRLAPLVLGSRFEVLKMVVRVGKSQGGIHAP